MKKNNIAVRLDIEIGDIVIVNDGHYCVIISNRIMKNGRIKGVPISTNTTGSKLVHNIPLRKKFFDTTDESGAPYKICWYNDGHGKVSSMMTKFFAKDPNNIRINSGRVGHINKIGIKFIRKHARRMVMLDSHILYLGNQLKYV